MGKIRDLTNQKFGRLTVLEFSGYASNRKTQWRCKCECGNEIIVKSNSLVTGHTKSCGCLEIETKKKNNKTHGLRYDPLYKIWLNMRSRCNNPNNSHYCYYGEKGIKICQEWDNSKNYSPENCTWILMSEQSKNRTYNHQIEYGGKLCTIAEISELTGVKPSTLYSRMRNKGTIYLKNGKIK